MGEDGLIMCLFFRDGGGEGGDYFSCLGGAKRDDILEEKE